MVIDKPVVSIIIPAFNQWIYTYNCIATIGAACQRHSYEVILADDGSTDETTQVTQYFKNLVVIRDNTNRRFVHNCNHAAKHAKGEFLFFLNNDTKCCLHAIDLLIEAMLANSKIGIVGSKLVYPDGKLQECGGIIWADGSGANYGRNQPRDLPGYLHARQVDYVSGAALMVRKRLWDEFGGFDGRYSPAYYEDADLAMTARFAGYQVWVEPRSTVIHYEGVSNGTDTTSGLKAHQITNRQVFLEKWRATLALQHYQPSASTWLAAERPLGKICILVVDHYVPMADQDAGGVCTKHYLSAMASTGARIIFMGENFHRTEPYTTELEEMGIEVWVGNWFANHWRSRLEEYGQGIDMVLFNRPHITEKFFPEIRKVIPQAKMLYFGVDLHCLREERAATFAKTAKQKDEILERALEVRKQEAAIYEKMDSALTISHDEADQIRNIFNYSKISVFPGYNFPIRDVPHPIPDGPPTAIFVGGFGHAPNHDGVDWFVAEIWPMVKRGVPEARFWIVGSQMPDHYKMLGQGIEALGRISDTELAERYARSTLVVAPLRYGAGLKGKIVQATCEGLPIVTTTIGIEGLSPHLKSHLGAYDDAASFAERVVGLFSARDENLDFRVKSLALARESYSVEASRLFFAQFLNDHLPPHRWITGYSEDGWIGPQSLIRLRRGAYRLTVWCPNFHFLGRELPLEVRVKYGDSVVASWRHSQSECCEIQLPAVQNGLYAIEMNRGTIPACAGIGDDSRTLGVKIVSLVLF